MKSLLLPLFAGILLISTGCSDNQSSNINIVYRIPVDKQEAAAKMVTELVQANAHAGYSPEYVMNSAMNIAAKVYGEPVRVGQ